MQIQSLRFGLVAAFCVASTVSPGSMAQPAEGDLETPAPDESGTDPADSTEGVVDESPESGDSGGAAEAEFPVEEEPQSDSVYAGGVTTEQPDLESPIDDPMEMEAHGDVSDPDAVFRAFSIYAKDQKARRIAGSLGGVAIGGTTIALGAILHETVDANPEPWFIIGGVTAGLSLIGLFMPSPAEQLAHQYRADQLGHSAEEAEMFERKWEAAAGRAKSARIVGGVINLVLGAGATGAGIAILSGAGNLDDTGRGTWGSVLIAAGAGVMTAGVTSFIIKSPVETSYNGYMASQPGGNPDGFEVSFGAGPSGVGLSMSRAF